MRGRKKKRKSLTLSGNVFLQFKDDAQIGMAVKGDITLYPCSDHMARSISEESYYRTGYAGYFRADVYDGFEWKILVLTDFCMEKEHHFRKKECSIDTFEICAEIMRNAKGSKVYRGYRDGHYALGDDEDDAEEEQNQK